MIHTIIGGIAVFAALMFICVGLPYLIIFGNWA